MTDSYAILIDRWSDIPQDNIKFKLNFYRLTTKMVKLYANLAGCRAFLVIALIITPNTAMLKHNKNSQRDNWQ
jgi:hypothetical protein